MPTAAGSPDRRPAPTPVRPAYDRAWIGAVVPALLDGSSPSWLPRAAAEAEAAVLLVIDGLGWHAIEDLDLPDLGSMGGGPITTCAPSTTSAALTSITTGLPPAQHGIVGFRMRVDGGVLNVLFWQHTDEEHRPDPEVVQPHRPFGGRDVPVVSRPEFEGTGFSDAHLRGARMFSWRTPAVLVERCRRLVAGGEPFVYAYYDGVDQVAHEFGLRDGYFAAEVAAADRLVGALRDALPSSCALVVTADHGHVHIAEDGRRDLDAVADLCAAYGGDGRCRGLHARPGAADDLLAAAGDSYGDEAWVLSREQLIDEGWLGPGASDEVRGRVGDVVVAANAPVNFVAPDLEDEGLVRAHHGSFTADEMLVPLLAAPGRAR